MFYQMFPQCFPNDGEVGKQKYKKLKKMTI